MDDKILKERLCLVCGKKFDVKLEEGNKIPVQYFFSKNLMKNLTDIEGEYWECENCSGFMKEKMKEWVITNWGERCPDYEEGCPCCQAWKCYDYLFQFD
jgi:hypothetical protein